MAEWRFPSNDYGEMKGINDTGIATFRGTPLKSLAREICQNSLDAAIEFPVTVDFNLFQIKSSEIPGRIVLQDTFEKCLDFWKSQKAISTKEHFKIAANEIKKEKCNVLRISDFNTSGLTGSTEEINTNWTNLTKSSGASDKKGTAGGSYGIGKFAPFACSDLSTVFYSTYDENGLSAYQGVSRLVSFRRDDEQTTQGMGYFGNERNTPVNEQLSFDPGFDRTEKQYGTDIYVIGYKYAGSGWEKNILISVLDGFLGAIWNERLIVKIGDVIICKTTLEELIDTYRDELTGYADKYYEVLKSEKTDWDTQNIMGLGEVELGLLLGDPEAPKRVGMIRKTGMKIKDKDRLPGHVPFVGVMFINGNEINQRLRLIENPEHTEWQPDRSKHPIQERALLREMNKYIRNRIEELVSQGSSQEMDAVGVGSFLPDNSEESRDEATEETVSNTVMDIVKKVIEKKPATNSNFDDKNSNDTGSNTSTGDSELGGDGEEWPHPGGRTENPGYKPGVESHSIENGDKGAGKMSSISLNKFRPICVDKETGKYVLVITPNESGSQGCLELFLSAESQRYKAPIIIADVIGGECQFHSNRITGLEFKKGELIRISLELDYSDYCSMEVKAYAISK